MTLETTELRLASRIEAVAEAATALSEFMKRANVDDDSAFGIDMAVREAVTNAVLHGNKLDEKKFVEINFKQLPGSLEFTVHDEGRGFNPDAVPDPTQEENILKSSGRGIFFMHNFMDEVDWSINPVGGTTVRMSKRL